jgi:hypothetical protein
VGLPVAGAVPKTMPPWGLVGTAASRGILRAAMIGLQRLAAVATLMPLVDTSQAP